MATQHELTILGKNAARECAEADLANPDFLKSENADSRLEQHAQDRAMHTLAGGQIGRAHV